MDKQNRFLLFLEKGNVWDLPGGGLGFGENPSDCLVRELWEEAGLEVTSVAERPSYFVTGQNGNWIGIDRSGHAIEVIKNRLDDVPNSLFSKVEYEFMSEDSKIKDLIQTNNGIGIVL